MKKIHDGKAKIRIFSIRRYLSIFLVNGISLTSCIIILLLRLVREQELNSSDLYALFAFGNVLFISLIYTIIYGVTRRFTTGRTVSRLLDASDKVKQGDFSVRIPEKKRILNEFDIIVKDFNMMVSELSSNELLKVEFISNVSHEIKTPLAIIESNVNALLDEGLTESEKKAYIDSTISGVQKLSELVSNILKLNKLESQGIFPKKQNFDISEQLRLSLIFIENLWSEKEINMECDIPDVCTICSDSQLLDIVWYNLLTNAVKFTPEGGTISVRLKDNSDSVTVEISDTGCGISESDLSKIFEKFYQGDTSRKTDGNGLGLALVNKVVNILDAKITVESEQGVGSTFSVTIPNNKK